MEGMTIIVKTVAIWVKVIIFIFGIYIILYGDKSPGGGFAGGSILASVYVLLMLAFGKGYVRKEMPPSLALKIACGAVFTFVSIAMCGLFFGKDAFFWNFIYQEWLVARDVEIHLIEAGIIALAEFAIGLIVAALVYLVIFNLSTTRVDVLVNERK